MQSWSPLTPSSSIPLEGGSHLLSQSLPSPDPSDASSHIYTGPGGADLSLSELSLSDKLHSRDGPRFSLLAPPSPPPLRFPADQSTITEGEECEDEDGGSKVDGHDDADNTIMERAIAEKTREDKLQSDLFILKKLNASFAVLNDALRATKGATEQVAKQLSQTDGLLDKYANLLGKSESVTRLIFDERWEGADADEELFVRERGEALERARLEQERQEAAIRAAEEQARREAEEAAQRETEVRARQEEAAALASKALAKGRSSAAPVSSGVRGVRGTRATAMASRGARILSKTASTSASAIPRVRSASATGSVTGGSGTRPSSSASRGSRGIPKRS